MLFLYSQFIAAIYRTSSIMLRSIVKYNHKRMFFDKQVNYQRDKSHYCS